ncbi:MAG: hypothetical protein ACRDTC_11570 [Pseudonocardiaceae bacterium]
MNLWTHQDHPHASEKAADDIFALEHRFDPAFVARLALREKQVQQSYRPMIGIHKWFARRPGTLFRGLLLAEFGNGELSEDYWRPHDVRGVVIDPFMGGGTTIYEALRLGLDVVGVDVNPMAYWLVHQGVEHIDLLALRTAGEAAWKELQREVGYLYETQCCECGSTAEVKYFLWVKTCGCPSCGERFSLFPGYRLAEAVRHPREVFHCPTCEALSELPPHSAKRCRECETNLNRGNVRRGTATCTNCDHSFKFAPYLEAPPQHRLVGIEYQCTSCYPSIKGRQFKTPDTDDIDRVAASERLLAERRNDFVLPQEEIPRGDETDRLHRWGYRRYQDMFTARQLLGLGILRGLVAEVQDARIRHALATVFSDFLRYQNLLCRYDTYALKCQDIFSVHGFPVGLIVCENNLPGIPRVGSGSFIHFVEKYLKAKQYAQQPYETRHEGRRKIVIPVLGESAEATLREAEPHGIGREAFLTCGSSQSVDLRPRSLDAVFTDPPYFDNVQYAELMDFCYVWLRTLVGAEDRAFEAPSTRTPDELTGNITLARGLQHFAQGLSELFSRTADALKHGAPLVFTYHHNNPDAYMPLVLALLDAQLTVTTVLPAPGEMAASLHIAGTKSSILDSVFVCRDREFVVNHPDAPITTGDVESLVAGDIAEMSKADYMCTAGDILCLRAGHLAAAAIRGLGGTWDQTLPLKERVTRVLTHMATLVSTVEPTETVKVRAK